MLYVSLYIFVHDIDDKIIEYISLIQAAEDSETAKIAIL